MKKMDNSINTRSGFRGSRNLMLYNNTDKLILKTGCDSKNKTKYPHHSDKFSDVDNFLKLFFFLFCSAYYFRIPEMVFADVHRRRFDLVSADLFRASR